MSAISHISIADVIANTGVTLKRKSEIKLVGPHPRHKSNSGECLVVFEDKETWWCSSCEQKGDAVDWLVDIGEVENIVIETRKDGIEYLIETYGPSPQEWQNPLPFPELSGPEFPVWIFPENIQRFINEVSHALQVPLDLVAGLVLSVLAAVASDKVTVRIRDGWLETVNIYVILVLDSGEGKTPAFAAATRPLLDLEREAVEEAQPEITRLQTERDILEGQLVSLKKEAAKTTITEEDRKAITEHAIETAEVLSKLEVPGSPKRLVEDITSEALMSRLAENNGVLAMFSDEGGIFDTWAGRYSDGHLAIDVYTKGYSGSTPIRVDRKGREPEFIQRPRLTMCLCVQPEVMRKTGDTPGLRGRGLLARPALIIPKSMVGFRDENPEPVSTEARETYDAIIRGLDALDAEGDEICHVLRFSEGAALLYREYLSELEPQLRPGGQLRGIRDWISKLRGLVGRTAALLHLSQHWQLAEPWNEPITIETTQAAIALGRYLTEHALAAFAMMGQDGRNAAARDTWETIKHNWATSFTQRDLWQHVRRRYRDIRELSDILDVLEDLQYLRRQALPTTQGRGRAPSPRYEVNPLALSEDLDPDPETNSVYNVYGLQKMNSAMSADESFVESSDNITDSIEVTEERISPTLAENEISNPGKCTQCTQNSGETCIHDLPINYITDVDSARKIVSDLQTEQVIGLDIETTGLDPVLDKIRTIQLATTSAAWVIDAYSVPLCELIPILKDGPTKVIQNAKFDASFLYNAPGGSMPEPMYDTMLADQVIHHRKYARSLKDLAEEYLGIELEKDQQVSEWNSEQLMPEQIRYGALDAAVLIPLYEALTDRTESIGLTQTVELENRTIPSIVWMERKGVGFDRDKWNVLVEDARHKLVAVEDELNTLVTDELGEDDMIGRKPYVVNWSSSAQVLKVLGSLGIEMNDSRYETLERRTSDHPIVSLILKHRETDKKLSTYGDKWTRHIHPATERIHADWRQIGAATGRMACSKPNLQNLPRDKAYRACFTPAPNRVLIKADYSQIELRIAAELANDSRMKQAFSEGIDLHSLTATMVNGKTNVVDVTPDERQLAKAVNFGLIYGMGAERLSGYARSSYGVELDLETATAVRNRYFSAYPDIRKWHRVQGHRIETRTVVGRFRTFDGEGHFTERLNSPVQGSGADGLKLALARLWETRGDIDAYPVLTVHDEIVVEASAEIADEAKAWLEQCMVEGMQAILNEVPVVVESQIKDQW